MGIVRDSEVKKFLWLCLCVCMLLGMVSCGTATVESNKNDLSIETEADVSNESDNNPIDMEQTSLDEDSVDDKREEVQEGLMKDTAIVESQQPVQIETGEYTRIGDLFEINYYGYYYDSLENMLEYSYDPATDAGVYELWVFYTVKNVSDQELPMDPFWPTYHYEPGTYPSFMPLFSLSCPDTSIIWSDFQGKFVMDDGTVIRDAGYSLMPGASIKGYLTLGKLPNITESLDKSEVVIYDNEREYYWSLDNPLETYAW